ncbi:autotransporter domain-containing protein [Selenomonas sp. FOBRC6]|uniref:autotransporter domain-containing protein n=1 Tax=Selenomonas sp. FOBRC6 TaxID=936572 RepID=UPI0012EAADEC|nr:autotransporter domain-containing protein [Selenomonas sp. FOBRC6]
MSYDNASTYFAGHVGVGQEWKLANGNKIEGYAKYFYSHQAGDTVKLRSGGILEFGDVDSHRLRVGARYTHAVGGSGELYAGLAYEHEFGGDATATYQGYSTPSPSLGGGTGILELGYRFAPKDGRVSYGVNLMGMTGQREGIAGGAQVTWAF